jgi:hypothetical protein
MVPKVIRVDDDSFVQIWTEGENIYLSIFIKSHGITMILDIDEAGEIDSAMTNVILEWQDKNYNESSQECY